MISIPLNSSTLSFQSSYYVPCNGLLGLPFQNNKSLYVTVSPSFCIYLVKYQPLLYCSSLS